MTNSTSGDDRKVAKRVNAAEAKARLASLVAEVAFGGQHVIIERRGRPLAALVSMADLKRLEQDQDVSTEPHGVLALVGAWRDVSDQELDTLLADIYEGREKDKGRPVKLDV